MMEPMLEDAQEWASAQVSEADLGDPRRTRRLVQVAGALAEKIAKAINAAKAGRIIADSEELVRDAHAEFRRKAYQRALDLLPSKALQEGFSPSADRDAE